MIEKGLESLVVWQKARKFAVFVCKEILPKLPVEERYALTQQLRRSVQSIPANIAEAHGRFHFQDSIRFCYIARGSLDETLNHLIISHDLQYVTDDDIERCRAMWRDIYRLLQGYVQYLRKHLGKGQAYRIKDSARLNGFIGLQS